MVTRKRSAPVPKPTIQLHKIGHYAFFVGLILAIALAFITSEIGSQAATATLVILGLIVGLLNITRTETLRFLVASLVLIIAPSATAITVGNIDPILTSMWANVVVLVAIAAIVVAIKAVYQLASDY